MKLRRASNSGWMIVAGLLLLSYCTIKANPTLDKSGSIKGTVLDEQTYTPIVGATVLIPNSTTGTVTDENGQFTLKKLPVGTYSVMVRSIGYQTVTRTDVIVRAGRSSTLEIRMMMTTVDVEDIDVNAGYFNADPVQPTSTISYSAEEVRRAPGSAGDVSRILFSLPSVAKVNDQVNSLIVRGGNPSENSFYINNIEIPNINHYPTIGTSGGPISLVNTDFISDVTFSAGGFSALYGDRLSSVMELSFREGNREQFDAQLDFNMAGIGLIGEGPINNDKGSWLFSARRSYLDLLIEAIGTGVVPKYSDYQGKVVYDLSNNHQLTWLGILGVDYIDFDRESAEDEDQNVYGVSDGHEYTTGLNWRWIWNKNGISNTSISYLATKTSGDYFETGTNRELINNDSEERNLAIRNVNFYRINPALEIQFGAESKLVLNRYSYLAVDEYNNAGDTVPPLLIDESLSSPKVGLYSSFLISPHPRLHFTVGGRFDFFELTDRSHLAPRLAATYNVSDRFNVNVSFGIYYQPSPLILLLQNDNRSTLKDLEATHYVAGFDYLLSENTKLTVEGYFKQYKNSPMDPNQPNLFIVDELVSNYYFGNYEELNNDGEARTYGIEVTLQKKLVEGMYGLVSGSAFKSEYKDLENVWRDRLFDNGLLFSVEGGYKFNERWEVSSRWIFAGGAPYTPIDETLSRQLETTVLDMSNVNGVRHSDYHSLNLRVDRRFNFDNSNMTIFFSVWNAYDRKNVANYYWNTRKDNGQGGIETEYQWSMLPIIGLEYEF